MISSFFPLKKLRRSGRFILLVAILVVGAVAAYNEYFAASAWSPKSRVNPAGGDVLSRTTAPDPWTAEEDDPMDAAAWRPSSTPPAWRSEYKGQANLHIFEDWCGGSIAQLRKNLHYPLYPHSRTTVQKLAVSPQWTNYGLRIFGYLHPYADGEFVFAVSSDDNSQFWLSRDDAPANLQLLAWVGKTGTEWTAPGEFEKYASQTSRAVRLSARGRYFFEMIHKQNDRGTDHVEVAWKINQEGVRFMVIESKHISLYTNESTSLMSDVSHIPQTLASRPNSPGKKPGARADMLREDPRDGLYRVPTLGGGFLEGVLPDCSYKPSYVIKGFPLLRYQGLQFVHMSYIYPNDYTRLTHMETENTCFYHESPFYLERFGFSRYMRLDRPEGQEREDDFPDVGFEQRDLVLDDEEKETDEDNTPIESRAERHKDPDNVLRPDYGDDYDDYTSQRRRKLFAVEMKNPKREARNALDGGLRHDKPGSWGGTGMSPSQPRAGWATERNVNKPAEPARSKTTASSRRGQHSPPPKAGNRVRPGGKMGKSKPAEADARRQKYLLTHGEPGQHGRGGDAKPGAEGRHGGPSQRPLLNSRPHHARSYVQRRDGRQVQRFKDLQQRSLNKTASLPQKADVAQLRRRGGQRAVPQPAATGRLSPLHLDPPSVRLNKSAAVIKNSLREKELELNVPLQQEVGNSARRVGVTPRAKAAGGRPDAGKGERAYGAGVKKGVERGEENAPAGERDDLWGLGVDSEGGDEEEPTSEAPPAPVFDPEVIWNQTFQVNHLDLQGLRSDWIDLRCNVSGNLMLRPQDAQAIVKAFMEKLNFKHQGRFTLARVVNVEKREDRVQGSRYLLELEVKDADDRLLRLSHFIYALIRRRRGRSRKFSFQRPAPSVLLCNPVGFQWNPVATVHFIVPVKNQARWVKQLILDMEELYRETRDPHFSLIITDYNSTDMDVEKALQASALPMYRYVKLSGNFERSAGLQAGVDLITDDHSIIFLCDLHIHFPPSIIDTIRKHCVEGFMAFAPIVMRLNCGATPREPRGYWEVNGFGLFGIYKSDLDAAGGMNTEDFTDRWGGEDWDLLDRILQSGLEVERIYLRNFFHHYHSKRGMWNRRTLPNPR